jgi:hypothetical protein
MNEESGGTVEEFWVEGLIRVGFGNTERIVEV